MSKTVLASLVLFIAILCGGSIMTSAQSNDETLDKLRTIKSMLDSGAGPQEVHEYYTNEMMPIIEPVHAGAAQHVLELIDDWKQDGDRKRAVPALTRGLYWIDYELIMHWTSADLNEQRQLDMAEQWTSASLGKALDKMDQQHGTFSADNLQSVIFPALRTAHDNENGHLYPVYLEMLDKLLLKWFVMDMAAQADTAEHALDEGMVKEASDHLLAAASSYQPLKNVLQTDQASGRDRIGEWLQDAALFDAKKMKQELVAAANRKIQQNMYDMFVNGQTPSDGWLIDAADSVATVAMLETIIVELKGEGAYQRIVEAGETYFAAVRAGNGEEAESRAFHLLKLLSLVKGVVMAVEDQAVVADGQVIDSGERIAWLDPTTERTVVSTRFVAEALGAAVEFDMGTKSVQITREGETMLMTVGSRNVTHDSKVIYQMEQPLALSEGRVYVPLRAAAELLGHQLYWYKGEIVLN